MIVVSNSKALVGNKVLFFPNSFQIQFEVENVINSKFTEQLIYAFDTSLGISREIQRKI